MLLPDRLEVVREEWRSNATPYAPYWSSPFGLTQIPETVKARISGQPFNVSLYVNDSRLPAHELAVLTTQSYMLPTGERDPW
jgi:hypothetical protein